MSGVTDALGNLFSGGGSSSSGGSQLGNILGGFGNILSGIGGAASQTGGVDPNTGQPIDTGQSAVQSANTSSAGESLIDPAAAAQAGITAGQNAPTQNQNQDPQGPQQGQNRDQFAPQSAVEDLKKALTNLRQQQRQNPWQTGGPNTGPDARQLNRAGRIPTGQVPPAPAQPADLPSPYASAMEFSNDNPPPPAGYPSIDPADAVRAGLRTNAPDTGFRIPGAPANENAPGPSFSDYLQNLRQGAAQPAGAPAAGPVAGGAGGPPGTPPIDPWGGLAGLARSMGLGPAGIAGGIMLNQDPNNPLGMRPAETGELPPGGFESRPGTTIAGPASEVLREGEGGPALEDQPAPAPDQKDPRDPPLGREDKRIDPRTGKPFRVIRDKNIDPKTGKPWVLPTKKDGTPDRRYEAPPGPYERGPIMRDVTGGQSIPPLLGQIAQMALPLLIGGLMGGFGGDGGGRGPHIRGFGMYRRGGFGGGRHFGGGGPFGGHWPYHHPQHGWDLHGDHPGQGWRPMDPRHFRDLMARRDGDRPLGYAGGGGSLTGNPQLDQWLSSLGLGESDGQNQGGGRNQVGFGGDNWQESNIEPSSTVTGRGPNGQPLPYTGQQAADFTRQVAQQLGVDPNQALRVLRAESGFGQNYSNRNDPGAGSYGPFQLDIAPGALGQAFMNETGEDPRDPKTWKDQIVFALRYAQKRGWGPWTTAQKMGFGNRPAGNPNSQFAWDYGHEGGGRTTTGGTMSPNPTGNAPVQVGEAGGLPVYQ